jgi:undecaprenyl-diphosphatase
VSHIADWLLGLHGWVVLAVVFALPALESSAFVGFLFPGEIAVLLGGVLAFEHRAALGAVIAAAILGAIVGDSIGYFVGKKWGRQMLHGTIGRFVKHEHLDHAQEYVAKRGGKAVFFGRFTAALRVLVPGLAGLSGMRYKTFALYNVAGGALWATGFVLAGYAAGSGWRSVEHIAGRASLVLFLLIVVIGALVLAARWIRGNPERVRSFLDRMLALPLVSRVWKRYQSQFAFVAGRFRPGTALGLSLTGGILLIGLAGWGLGVLIQDVVARDDLALIDGPVERFFVAHREAWVTTAMKWITVLGDFEFLVPMILVVGGIWWYRRGSPRPLALLLGSFVGAATLADILKPIVGRPRPPVAQMVGSFSGWAFPSGHATQATAVFGMLAVLIAVSASSWTRKVGAWFVATLVILMVGLSRVYLGVHWLTDVFGGYALGALWLSVLIVAVRTRARLHGGSPTQDVFLGSRAPTTSGG